MTVQNSKIQRRGFLRSILRYGVAVGAAAGSAVLYHRNGAAVTETACRDPQGRTGCGACGLLTSCGLPRGLSYRNMRKEAVDG